MMKRKLLAGVACIAMSGMIAGAQTPQATQAAPATYLAPPPPPTILTAVQKPGETAITYSSTIINENGYEIMVRTTKSVPMVYVTKDNKTQKIRLSTWQANKKYYEKKYGKLPPPPPPPPIPPTPPVPSIPPVPPTPPTPPTGE